MVLRIVTVEYLQMQNINITANTLFPEKNSNKVISAISSRRNPVTTEHSSRAYTSSAPTASTASKRPRFASLSIHSFIFNRTNKTLCAAAKVWNTERVRVFSALIFRSFALSATTADFISLLVAVSSAHSFGIFLNCKVEVVDPYCHYPRLSAPRPQLQLLFV